MARSRILKPGFFTNELLAELPFEARLLFAGLWTLADREGRLEDRPKRIGAAIFPYDLVDIDAVLGMLAEKGFIVRYQIATVAVIGIPTWKEHQHPHAKESPSVLPARVPDVASPVKVVAPTEKVGASSPCSISSSSSISTSVCDPVSPPAAAHTPEPFGPRLFSGRDHLGHAACGRPCVPASLHRKFIDALGGSVDAANERLRDWYAGVQGAIDPDAPIEPDAFKFWQPRFQGAFVKPGGVVAVYAPRPGCQHEQPCPDTWSHAQLAAAEASGDTSTIDAVRQLIAKRAKAS